MGFYKGYQIKNLFTIILKSTNSSRHSNFFNTQWIFTIQGKIFLEPKALNNNKTKISPDYKITKIYFCN